MEDGAVHLAWREGDVTDHDPMGYMRSEDFGKAWGKGGVAFSTGKANHPYSIGSDGVYVYVLTGPLEKMVFSRLAIQRTTTETRSHEETKDHEERGRTRD
jgi:hypothetical protein